MNNAALVVVSVLFRCRRSHTQAGDAYRDLSTSQHEAESTELDFERSSANLESAIQAPLGSFKQPENTSYCTAMLVA